MKIKKTNNLLLSIWAVAIFFLIVALILKLWTPELRLILCLAIGPGGFLVVWFSTAIIFQKMVRKITPLLFEQCDPDQFLNSVYAETPPVTPGKSPNYLWVMLTYEGLYAAGRYKEALAELYKRTQFKSTRSGVAQQAAWYINFAEVSIALGRTDDARGALDDCRFILENRELAWKAQQVLSKTYQHWTCMLNIALGITDSAEAVLTERFEQAKNEYERVSTKYHFALLYRLTGEEEKAREALQYVAEHGNRLHYAALAREQLGLEPQPSVTC